MLFGTFSFNRAQLLIREWWQIQGSLLFQQSVKLGRSAEQVKQVGKLISLMWPLNLRWTNVITIPPVRCCAHLSNTCPSVTAPTAGPLAIRAATLLTGSSTGPPGCRMRGVSGPYDSIVILCCWHSSNTDRTDASTYGCISI
jgi:hypothetical protein